MIDHAQEAREILAAYDRERIQPVDGSSDYAARAREAFLARLIAEAQVHATLAIVSELENHRSAGWGQPA